MRKPFLIFFLSIIGICFNPFTFAQTLVHPGILHTTSELDFVKSKIDANQQPWKNAYTALSTSSYAQLTYVAHPYDYVQCGSFNTPNVGCDEMVEDGMAAYSLALMWYFTKNSAYANKSIQIINAWSVKYVENPLQYSNSRLVVSWAAPWYVNAAEILRYTGTGWSAANIAQFNSMLTKFMPYVLDETMPGNNWIQSAIEAHMAIAIFKNDVPSLNAAANRWKARCKTYLYQSTDGPVPAIIPGKTQTQTNSIWKDGSTSLSFINGLGMETCRDLGHLKLGFNSMIYAAEAAWHQGIDLFSPEKKRLADFMELHGSWMTGAATVPTNICDGTVKAALADATGIQPPSGGGRVPWEIAYNHLHDRLGLTLPYTLQMINATRPAKIGKWVFKWETLTHAGRSFSPLPVELILFEAALGNQSVKLRWTTSWERNNDKFVVEKSIDGIDFQAIASLKGMGSSDGIHEYQYADYTISNETTYYRLAQIDHDGVISYSERIKVVYESPLQLILSPNPFETSTLISTDADVSFSFFLTNINGTLLETGIVSLNNPALVGHELHKGIYFVRLIGKETNVVFKIIKQ